MLAKIEKTELNIEEEKERFFFELIDGFKLQTEIEKSIISVKKEEKTLFEISFLDIFDFKKVLAMINLNETVNFKKMKLNIMFIDSDVLSKFSEKFKINIEDAKDFFIVAIGKNFNIDCENCAFFFSLKVTNINEIGVTHNQQGEEYFHVTRNNFKYGGSTNIEFDSLFEFLNNLDYDLIYCSTNLCSDFFKDTSFNFKSDEYIPVNRFFYIKNEFYHEIFVLSYDPFKKAMEEYISKLKK